MRERTRFERTRKTLKFVQRQHCFNSTQKGTAGSQAATLWAGLAAAAHGAAGYPVQLMA